VEQAPQVLLTHASPIGQLPKGGLQPCALLGWQMPELHVSGDWQSPFTVHVHCVPVCVDPHTAVGPHWLLDVQVTHWLPTQTWPGMHWLFVVQLGQPPVHCWQTMYGLHMEKPPWQYSPTPHEVFDVHWWPLGLTTH